MFRTQESQSRIADNKTVPLPTPPSNLEFESLVNTVLSLSSTDASSVKILLTSLLMEENNEERITATSLSLLKKKVKDSPLVVACEKLVEQFYNGDSTLRSAYVEHLKTTVQHFSTYLPKPNTAVAVTPESVPEVRFSSSLSSAFDYLKALKPFLVNPHADLCSRILLLESLFTGKTLTVGNQQLEGVYLGYSSPHYEDNLKKIYTFILALFNELQQYKEPLPNKDIPRCLAFILKEVLVPLTHNNKNWSFLEEGQVVMEKYQDDFIKSAQGPADDKHAITDLNTVIDSEIMIMNQCLMKSDMVTALQKLKEILALIPYAPRKPFPDERKYFIKMCYLYSISIPIVELVYAEDLFSTASHFIQLLEDVSSSYRKDLLLVQKNTILRSTVGNVINLLLKSNTREAMHSLARLVAMIAPAAPEEIEITDTVLLNTLFPPQQALSLFDRICLRYEKSTKPLTQESPDLVAFFKQQDEALEPLLAQWEAEDKAEQERLKKEKAQAQKRKKEKARATKVEKTAAESMADKPLSSSAKIELLYDAKSDQGKAYLAAGEQLRANSYPEAEALYHQAFESAQAASDHVIATASILELAECLMVQAATRLARIKAAIARGDALTMPECKEGLTTIIDLYQKASQAAEKSLNYCTEHLQGEKSVDERHLKQVDHLTRSIGVVFENASSKLRQVFDFIEEHRIKMDARLQQLAEGRQRAKERLGPLWNRNPNPRNREREQQVKAQRAQEACLQVKPQLEKLAQCVLLPTVQEFRVLHPAKMPLLQKEDEKAVIVKPVDNSVELSFIDRIKQMAVHRKSKALPLGLGSWTASGNHGVLAGGTSLLSLTLSSTKTVEERGLTGKSVCNI